MRWLVYFAIGAAIHAGVWHLPLDVQDWRFWGDLLLWPFVLMYHWEALLVFLPTSWLQGIGHLIGVLILFLLLIPALVKALGRGNDDRWR